MPSSEMKSPVSGKPMTRVTLEEGLIAYRCTDSSGHYITSNDYLGWISKQPARLPQLPESDPAAPDTSSSSARICPETGTLMTRYKVGHGFPFSIDRSITGGIWLDGGEWEALKQRNFHDEIHLVFTAPWQKQVRTASAQATYRDTLRNSLGEELFQRLTDLRTELMEHPDRNLALSYLTEKSNTIS